MSYALPQSTTCPYCGVGCGVDVELAPEKESLIAVSGAEQHPANFGRLCVKGSALHETTGGDGRQLYPEIGGKRASWDEALTKVADGFAQTIAEHGPDSVAFYLSGQLLTEDYYVANKLMKGFIGSANVDTNSRLCMASAVAGYKRAFGSDTVPGNYQDLECCDLLILVGSNAAWTHPILYQRMVAAKQKRPEMKVVVIDPRETATCDIADLHLAVAPGSDSALFNGLLAHVSQSESIDQGFIEASTEGYEELLENIPERLLKDPLSATANSCGLAESDLETLFDWFVKTKRTVTFYSQGVNQSRVGTDKCNAIINCHLATGRIGKPGAAPFSITGQPNAMGGREVGGLANQLAAHMDFAEVSVDRVKRFWDAPNIANQPGLKAVDMFDAIESEEIKAVWIMATNPVVSMPNADQVAKALKKCDLVVVSESYAETDTAKLADIVLPATTWSEKDGTVTNSERCISRQRAILPAPGEARHDWQAICDLATRMGWGEAFSFKAPHEIFSEHAQLSGFENGGTRDFDISGLEQLNQVEYDALLPIQWPVNKQVPTGTERMFTDGRFFTKTGKAQFVKTTTDSEACETSDEYPWILNSGRVRDQWHTMTRTARSARLLAHVDTPLVSISPEDALTSKVSAGDLIELQSPFGRFRAPAFIDSGLKKGHLFVPMHWNEQYASCSRVGAVIPPITDPISGQPELKQTAVSLEKVEIAQWLTICTKTELNLEQTEFWNRIPLAQGTRYEIALNDTQTCDSLLTEISTDAELTRYSDDAANELRLVAIEQESINLLLFASSHGKALPDRRWLGEKFTSQLNRDEAWILLAGSDSNAPAKGKLVCSCFEVGEIEIVDAILSGADTCEELGKRLCCGTNCGSCLPELKSYLSQTLAEEAA